MVTVNEVYRDFVTDGVPSSGEHDPDKADIRKLLSAMSTGSADGIYDFIPASNIGAGTSNVIVATTDVALPETPNGALIALPIAADNTASPVTVRFNGGTALTIKTSSGNDVSAAGLKAGMIVAGYVSGSTFRLLTDQASAAIVSAAEDAVDRAEAAAASLNLPALTSSDAAKQLVVNAAGDGYSALTGLKNVSVYGANGDGTTANDTAFGNANTAGGLIFIPKPATGYAFTNDFATTNAAWLPDPSISWDQLTDGGKLDLYRGHFTGGTNGANIWRFSDRVFIGEAASKWAGTNIYDEEPVFVKDRGTSWFGEAAKGPAYLAVGASLVVIAPENDDSGMRNGGLFASRSSDISGLGIALSAHVENVRTIGAGSAWATYFSAAHKAGVSGDGRYTYANETEVVDSSGTSIPVVNSYDVDVGAMGYWIHCGGHGDYGEDPTRPSASAITIGRGGTLGLGWVSGLTFISSGIYGTDGSAASTTYGNAINLARMHKIVWAEPGTKTEGASIYSKVTAAASKVTQEFSDDQIIWRGSNGNPILQLKKKPNGVTYVSIQNNASGSDPMIAAGGPDTNIDLHLTGKGSGVLRFGTHTAISSETTTGYITIQDDGGTTRKIAVVS